MAEVCTKSHRIPSWRLRRTIRRFMRGEPVIVEDTAGTVYSVEMKRDQLVFSASCDHRSRGAK